MGAAAFCSAACQAVEQNAQQRAEWKALEERTPRDAQGFLRIHDRIKCKLKEITANARFRVPV